MNLKIYISIEVKIFSDLYRKWSRGCTFFLMEAQSPRGDEIFRICDKINPWLKSRATRVARIFWIVRTEIIPKNKRTPNKVSKSYLLDTLNIFVKCTKRFSKTFENNRQASTQNNEPLPNIPTPFSIAFFRYLNCFHFS